jgi:predicted TPR repeat methyltransferase
LFIVLVYFGDLTNLLGGIGSVLIPNGVFAFTVEALEKAVVTAEGTETDSLPGFELMPSGRYAHSLKYIKDVSESIGMQVIYTEQVVPRLDRGQPIHAHLVLLRH